MERIEPIAAYVPYMTCPGNHEIAYNFSHYRYLHLWSHFHSQAIITCL
jgi:hypothetical protein